MSNMIVVLYVLIGLMIMFCAYISGFKNGYDYRKEEEK